MATGNLFPELASSKEADLKLKKHVATVWMTGISPMHRRLWNMLTYHAYYDLEEREEHRIPVTRILRDMKLNSRNYEYIRDLLRDLVTYNVEWDVLGTTGKSVKWGTTNMLAAAEMERGFVTYSYSPPMRRALQFPEMYALISLTLQNDFKNDYAPVLYEMVVQVYNPKDNRSYGTWIPLQKFRDMIGLGQEKYDRFTDFRRYVVERALEEINGKTPFEVVAEFDRRESRSYDHIKLNVKAKRPSAVPSFAGTPVGGIAAARLEVDGEPLPAPRGQVWAQIERLTEKARKSLADRARGAVEAELRRGHPELYQIYRREGIYCKQINPIFRRKMMELHATGGA